VIYASKYYEVAKYLSLTGHTYSPLIIMCSEQRWKKLSSGEKEIFQKAAREAAAFERNKMKDIIHDVLNKIKATGMLVNEVPDKKPFQEAVKPLYTKFEGEMGKDVLEAILKARDAAK
jgi:TRAP-type C4-dicarboxylate transport system substrate-binding protein